MESQSGTSVGWHTFAGPIEPERPPEGFDEDTLSFIANHINANGLECLEYLTADWKRDIHCVMARKCRWFAEFWSGLVEVERIGKVDKNRNRYLVRCYRLAAFGLQVKAYLKGTKHDRTY